MDSLTGILVNKFSTSSEANIPLLGLSVCQICIKSCDDFMSRFLIILVIWWERNSETAH